MGHAMDGWVDGCADADWKGRVLARSLTLTRPLDYSLQQQPGAERRSHGGLFVLLLLLLPLLSAGRLLR